MCLQAITIKPLMKLILIKVNLLFLLHQLTKHNNAKAGIAAILLALSSKLAKIRVAPIEVEPISTHSKTLQSSRFCFGSWEGEGGRAYSLRGEKGMANLLESSLLLLGSDRELLKLLFLPSEFQRRHDTSHDKLLRRALWVPGFKTSARQLRHMNREEVRTQWK